MIETKSLSSTTQPLLQYLRKQKENQRFQKSIELGGTLALITFFLFFAIRPTILTISALIGEIKSKELLSTSMRQKINQTIQAQDLFSQIQERYLVINSALPDKPRYAHAAHQLTSLATQQLLSYDRISLSNEAKTNQPASKNIPKNLSEFYSETSFSGSFESAVNLLTRLQNNRRLFSLDSIRFSPKEVSNLDSGSSPPTEINLSFSIAFPYWQENYDKK